MNNIRIPTLKQLEKFGTSAGMVLDSLETQLTVALAVTDWSMIDKRYHRNMQSALRRLQQRRKEFFNL